MGQRGMGGVYKRAGSRYWWIRYSYRGHEYRESTKSFSRKEANRLLQTRLGAIASGEFQGPPQERLVMRELFNAFLSDYTLRGGLHVSKIQSQMRPLRRAFDREPLRDVTERRIDKYIEDRVQQGYAPATINHETQYLGQSLRLAYRRRQLSRVPAIRKLPVHNARQGFFERAEFEALMQHLPIAIADIARFAYLSGWRKGEITRLEWRDVDLDGGVIRLRPEHSKTWAGRVFTFHRTRLRY